MAKSPNPRGNNSKKAPLIRDKHLMFIGECYAEGFSTSETGDLLAKEFGVIITSRGTRHYFEYIRDYSPEMDQKLKAAGKYNEETIGVLVEELPHRSKHRLVKLFLGFFLAKKRIDEDPAYGIAYAHKRRRIMKLDQNTAELDTPKVIAMGSYPTAKRADGSMDFKEFELTGKDHAEQRKTLESLDRMVEGGQGGDVIINITDNTPSEETDTAFEREARKKIEEIKKKKDARVKVAPKEADAV